MSSSERRNRVEIQTSRPGTKPNGQKIEIWSTDFSRWAKAVAVGGREGQQGYQQITADVTHVLELLWDPQTAAITPLNQLKWGDRELQIVRAYDPDNGRKQRIEIQAIERVQGV